MYQIISILKEAMGQRLRKIHLISGFKLFDALLTVVKQGLSTKLKERIELHPTFESLHKHVPPEYLPKDFGGTEKNIKELNGTYYLFMKIK